MPSRAVGPVAPAMIQFAFSSLGMVALQKLGRRRIRFNLGAQLAYFRFDDGCPSKTGRCVNSLTKSVSEKTLNYNGFSQRSWYIHLTARETFPFMRPIGEGRESRFLTGSSRSV